jgi:LysM repeat protein
MYQFYLNDTLLPIAPAKLTTKINNSNTTIDLVSIGEVNILKDIGLRDFSFKILLPGKPYPFVATLDDFKLPIFYLAKLREYKQNKETVRLIILREMQTGAEIFNTNLLVSIEDYTVEEIAGEEGDAWVNLNLREYKKPLIVMEEVQNNTEYVTEVIKEVQREEKPKATEHTVVSGDTLWSIAQRELNSGSRYIEIADLNGIKDPNRISVGQVLRLP